MIFDEPTSEKTVEKRPDWATALGIACVIGIFGIAGLGAGLAFAFAPLVQIGFAVSAVAAICALGGGTDYFLYGRKN